MAVYQYPNRRTDRPGTNIEVDTSAITGASSGSDKIVMIVGSAQGGAPNTVYHVRNMHQAQGIFRGGELLDALQMAWNPSVGGSGAGDILAMRVEDSTPATLTREGVTFESGLYGREANDTEVGLETIDVVGVKSRNLVIQHAPDGYKEVLRNIDEALVVEKEDDAPAYVGVAVSNGTLTLRQGDSEEEAEAELSIRLGQGSAATVNLLVNEINNVAGVRASVPLGGNRNINTVGIDDLPETEVEADGKVVLTALIANIVNQLEYNRYVDVKLEDSMYTENGAVQQGTMEDFPTTSLSGGSDGNVPTSWASKFAEFANEGGYYLVPLTDNPAVHAEAAAFVKDRTDNAEPMRVIAGAGYNESVNQLLSRASVLHHPRVMMIGYSGRYNYPDGRYVETPGYMFAAQVAGLASGLGVGEAITNKEVNVTDLAMVHNSTELDALNSGGVVMAEFVRNGRQELFRIVDDRTTYRNQDDPINNQMGVGEGSDFLVSELKIMLDEQYIGTKIIDISASVIKNSVQSFLDQKKRDQEIQDYNPEDVQVVIEGEVANISLVVTPVRSLKQIEVSLVYNTQQLYSA